MKINCVGLMKSDMWRLGHHLKTGAYTVLSVAKQHCRVQHRRSLCSNDVARFTVRSPVINLCISSFTAFGQVSDICLSVVLVFRPHSDV